MKVLVIPDIHLKHWMLEIAAKLIKEGDYDEIVLLGDLVDDWNQELNDAPGQVHRICIIAKGKSFQ